MHRIATLAFLALLGGCPQEPVGDSSQTGTAPAKGLSPGIYIGSPTSSLTITQSGGYADGDPNRLAPNDSLRQACDLFTDAELAGLLFSIDQERLSGTTVEQQLGAAYDSCGSSFGCVTCFVTVIQQVYSIDQSPPETSSVTDAPQVTIAVGDDGLPSGLPDVVQVSGFVIQGFPVSSSTDVGVVTATYNVRIDVLDTDSGEVLASMFGTGLDLYEQLDDRTLRVNSTIVAGLSDSIGTFDLRFETTGTLSR